MSQFGSCSLYNTVSIAVPSINKETGNPIPFLSDYYTKNK